MSELQGSCQCGNVTYRVISAPLMTYACHCQECQKRTGSAFSMGTVCLADSFNLSGELTSWTRTSDDGNRNTRYSCANCTNIIYGASTNAPEAIRLQPGTLDNCGTIIPDVHIWTKRALPWVAIPSDSISYPTQPDDLRELLPRVMQKNQSNA